MRTNPLAELLQAQAGAPVPVLIRRFATVTSTAPLRVLLDGDEDALESEPISLVSGLSPGHRVRIELDGRQLIIIGRIHTY